MRAAENPYQLLFDGAADAIFVHDLTGRILAANRMACDHYGYGEAELLARGVADIDTPEHAADAPARIARIGASATLRFETRHRRKDGVSFPVEVHSRPVTWDGRPAIMSVCRDITHRHQQAEFERRLAARDHYLQAIIQTTADGFWILDTSGRVLAVNDAYCAMSGYTRDEVIGMGIGELDADESATETGARIERIARTGSELFVTRHRRKDGSLWSLEVSVTWVEEDGGRFVCFARDLTERARAEAALRQSEQLMRYVIEHANAAVAVHDRDLRYIYVSQRYLDQYKVRDRDVIGRHHYDVFPDLPQKWRDVHQRALAGEVSRADRDPYRRADGTVEWTRWECRPWYDTAGAIGGIIVYTEVITDWIAAEQTLREQEALLAHSQRIAQVGSWMLDNATNRLTWSDETYRIFGFEPRSFAPTYDAFLDAVHPDDRGAVNDAYRGAVRENRDEYEIAHRIVRRPTGETRNVHERCVFERDASGAITRAVGMVQDITERTRLEAQLAQALKMESVGRLAGGVAHDFNNMLGVILGYTGLAMSAVAPEDLLADYLREIHAAAQRSAEITQQLLAFARKQTIAPRTLDLNETIEGMLKMLRRLIGENIDLAWLPASGLWSVLMDPSQVHQILANLCVNARDAIGAVGRITIETGTVALDEAYCAAHAGFTPGRFVVLTVSDTGCGMDRETLDNLFEPFFTTKDASKGTGLGLATVYGIVKQNQGAIDVHSEVGRGTTFRLYLPAHEAPGDRADAHDQAGTPLAQPGDTILLVEDEPAILRLTQRVLELLGYSVLATSAPGEAFELARRHDGAIHLVVTDVVMPEMNGRELARRLAAIRPGLRCLFMSGYTANVIAHHGVLDDGVVFIQKPFSTQDLAAKVRQALDG